MTKAKTNIGWLQDQGRGRGREGLIYQLHDAEIARDQPMVDWIIDTAAVPIWKGGLISHDPSQRRLCIGYSNPGPRCFGVALFSFFFFSLLDETSLRVVQSWDRLKDKRDKSSHELEPNLSEMIHLSQK